MSKKVETSKSIGGFGTRGWLVIFYCFIMFWFFAGMINDGTNITAPAVAAKIGISYSVVLSMSTVAWLSAFVFFVIIGQINARIGARITSSACLIIAGIGYICVGQATSLVTYTVALCILAGTIMSAAYICGGVYVTNWFPKKKGIVMGYTTMGLNLASAIYVPLIAFLVGVLGVARGVMFPGLACILVGILGYIFMRATPMDFGKYPDNVSKKEYEKEYFTKEVDYTGGWTITRLLKTRELWLCAIPTGLIQLVTAGIVSQLVVRNMHLGFTQTRAIAMMTVIAIVGLFGSWAFGVLDQKIGTKKAMLLFGVWEVIALLANISETTIGVYVSIFMIGMVIGGSANFTISLPANVFGRHGFSMVNSVVFPIQGLLTGLNFIISALALHYTGSLRAAYIVFICVIIFSMILVSMVKEHKYNRDFQVEGEHIATAEN